MALSTNGKWGWGILTTWNKDSFGLQQSIIGRGF